MLFTTDSLIAAIRVRGRVPTAQSTFTDARIMGLIDDEIALRILPKIMKVRGNYYLTSKDMTLVGDLASYRIPARAVGSKIKSVKLVDNTGNESPPLPYIEEEQLHDYQRTSSSNVFYFKGNSLILVPAPSASLASSSTLRVHFFIRPSTVVAVSAAALITAIDTGTKTVTVSAVPSTITTGVLIDFVKATGGFDAMATDQSPTVSGTSVTFASLPTDLEVGDYIALAGQSPIPQIPAELFPLLELRVTKTILQSLGFMNEAKALAADLKDTEAECWTLISPRSEGNARKVVPSNSILRARSGRSLYFP